MNKFVRYFITTQELYENLEKYLVLDIQFVLGDEIASADLYAKGHIEGAIFLNLETDISDRVSNTTGRHPLPTVETFMRKLEEKGIDPSKKIAIYDNFAGAAAARVWWMLTTLGFTDVCVVIGGIDNWPYQLSRKIPDFEAISLNRDDFPQSWEEGTLPVVDDSGVHSLDVLVDCRNKERYQLKESGPDPVIGRIPGARNLPWEENVDKNSVLLSTEILKKRFEEIIGGKQGVFYCGSGVTACFNILLAKELGFGIHALYPGSWSEWYKLHPNMIS